MGEVEVAQHAFQWFLLLRETTLKLLRRPDDGWWSWREEEWLRSAVRDSRGGGNGMLLEGAAIDLSIRDCLPCTLRSPPPLPPPPPLPLPPAVVRPTPHTPPHTPPHLLPGLVEGVGVEGEGGVECHHPCLMWWWAHGCIWCWMKTCC